MIKTAIRVDAVSKIFGAGKSSFTALDQVSVDVAENEFFTLLGPSGCGKTTLLRLIAGFEHPSAGDIKLRGESIGHLPPFQRPINTVFQNYALFPHMTVAENVAFGLEMLKQDKATITKTVSDMLDLVKMVELKDRRVNMISGGQQQRVALARALAPKPNVLLLDEPLSALDYKLRKDMQIELKRLQSETGITFIFVTHDQEEALTMSDRVAVMSGGHILQVGKPDEIYERPANRFVADFIGDTNFFSAEVVSASPAVVKLSDGTLLGVDMTKHSPSIKVAQQLSLAVRPEQIIMNDVNAPMDEMDNMNDSNQIRGEIINTVYFGTDTHYHIKVTSGETIITRVQNTQGSKSRYQTGDKLSLSVKPNAIQLLADES